MFEKGQGYAEAIAAARDGVVNKDHDMRSSALILFKILVEHGQGLREATDVLPLIKDKAIYNKMRELVTIEQVD